MSDRDTLQEARKDLAKRTRVLKQVHAELRAADELRRSGRNKQAIEKLEQLVRLEANYFSAWALLGLLHMDQDNASAALSCFTRAVMLNPTDLAALINLSRVYARLNCNELAAQTLDMALRIDPENLDAQFTLADILNSELEHEAAIPTLEKAIRLEPSNAEVLLLWGRTKGNLGEYEEAWSAQSEAYRRIKSSRVDPRRLVQILYSLSLNPAGDGRLDIGGELAELAGHFGSGGLPDVFDFARAAVLHRQKNYEEAWNVLSTANDRVMATRTAEWSRMQLRNQVSKLYAQDLDSRAVPKFQGSAGDTIPIFIVGPSRSGKTTLEKLLSHSDRVKRGYESPLVDIAIRRASQLSGLPGLKDFWYLPAEADQAFVAAFQHELNRRSGGARYFTVTYPGTIHHAGRLAQLIPNAVFVFVTRNRDDQVFRIFQRNYSTANHYSYSIDNAYEYVDWYYSMAELWAAKLSSRAAVVAYEDMVADPGGVLARIKSLLPGLDLLASSLTIADDRGCAAPYLQRLHEARGVPSR